MGSSAPIAAAAMGAAVIEKHITNDPNRLGPDHRFSATPEVMVQIAAGSLNAHLARGRANKGTTDVEKENKSIGRRSAFAIKNLGVGTILTRAHFRFVRPSSGIPANDTAALIGAILLRPVMRGHPIRYEDIQ